MKFVARVAFYTSLSFGGDLIQCSPTKDGMLPYVVRDLAGWGVRVKMVKRWVKV